MLLNRGDVDETGVSNYPRKQQNTPGDLVYQLQDDLRQLGYLMAAPDGVFGEGTERAVRQFQRDRGLDPPGEVETNTKKVLRNALKRGQKRDEGDSYTYLKQQVVSLDYGFDQQNNWVNLLGVRGFWHGEVVANTFNLYNDTIFALWLDDQGTPHSESFEASCDPGRLSEPTENGSSFPFLRKRVRR